MSESCTGQTAIVTGESDVCAAAKVLKGFHKEFDKSKVRVGILDNKLLNEDEVSQLASLPSREALLSQLLGLLQTPGGNLARLLNEPGASLARVLQAHVDKG
ncbi:MAG: 50S ribosomal protein L10 [Verrucomicrobiota bacterium]